MNNVSFLYFSSKQSMCPDYGGNAEEKLWKKLVECQAYNDRVTELLSRLGNHIKIIFRFKSEITEHNYKLYIIFLLDCRVFQLSRKIQPADSMTTLGMN